MITTDHITTLIRHPLKLKLQQGSIGCPHDLYGWTCIYAERCVPMADAGAAAAWYEDGLGACRLELIAPDGRVTRREEWFNSSWRATVANSNIELKAQLLFKIQTGIKPLDAEIALRNVEFEPDPMGPLSRYA